jgi:processive 1,2-diacylglycerol beta-glucosyltransferase
MSKKILLLSVSAGAGHVRAAEALRAYAQDNEDIDALHLDVMNYVPTNFRKLYADFYIRLITRHPRLWGMLYQISGDARPDALVQKLRRAMERLNTRALRKAIEDFGPDAIVCTHFLPAEMLMHEINHDRFHIPVWVQVTDFDLHRMWVIPRMTGYFAANEEIAFRMQACGIAPDAVHTTGIPIMPAFATPPDRATCCAELGIDTGRPVFMLMGGGAGVGKLDQVARNLLALDGDFQLLVLAGKNVQALATLTTLAADYPGRLFPHGFTDKVERLMACADLVITKPGGLTTSECLAMGLPMIVNAPIPGQEEHNADFLLEQGAALKAIDEVALNWRVQHLIAQPQTLASMATRAAALGRPHAARQVLDIVLAQLAGR